MTVHLSANGTITLEGICPVEDAERLLQYLLANPGAAVDWHTCESAHTAVVQVLLIAGSTPLGTPISAFLRDKVASLLNTRK